MGLFQPKVTPHPTTPNLSGKTAVITGATGGLGLETARQLLRLNISTLVLAVRNIAKGETCIQDLRNDPIIRVRNPNASIHVLKLDMNRYDSVIGFARALEEKVAVVDILVLNAGMNSFTFERSVNGHEQSMQVNYCSNVLLITELLPYLESCAEKTGAPVRITWLGSRTYYIANSLEKRGFVKSGESVLGYMDSESEFQPWKRYADTKLLCAMFVYALAPKLDEKKVVINMVCPGMVATDLGGNSPILVRVLVAVLKAIRARPVEVGGLLVVNAVVVAGVESHGELIGDKDIVQPTDFIKSSAGQQVQKKLWAETMEDLAKITTLPSVFTR
ncbi:hypothetical protein BDW59DRAFT_106450 [Aspergillus cavernicola]|uniref:Short-chain dehydrogenase/reductase family protein n=1 Tax=Aspergillus cavernicola TaxID=176166 RepID=A0ABR4IXX2_9EURO